MTDEEKYRKYIQRKSSFQARFAAIKEGMTSDGKYIYIKTMKNLTDFPNDIHNYAQRKQDLDEIKKHRFKKKGRVNQNYVGGIGEILFARYFNLPLPEPGPHYVDFKIGMYTVDVKTMEVQFSKAVETFHGNVNADQLKGKPDDYIYVFARWGWRDACVLFSGWATHKYFMENSVYRPEGGYKDNMYEQHQGPFRDIEIRLQQPMSTLIDYCLGKVEI